MLLSCRQRKPKSPNSAIWQNPNVDITPCFRQKPSISTFPRRRRGHFFASNGQTKPLCTNRTNFETRPFCRPSIRLVTKRQPKDRDRQGGRTITLYCRCRDGTPLSSSPPPPWSAELTRSTQPCQEDGPSPPRPSSSFFHAGFKGLDLFAEQLQAALRAQNVSREAFVRNELTRHAFSSGKRAPARRNHGTPKRPSRAQQTWRLREVSPQRHLTRFTCGKIESCINMCEVHTTRRSNK